MAGGILGKAAAKALELLKKRAGKGATDTFKKGGKRGEFGGKTKVAEEVVENPKGGFEADMIGKGKKKLTRAEQKKALYLKRRGAEGDAADNPNALETPGYSKDITRTDDEIALSIATDELGGDLIGQQLKHAAKTAPKTSKLKLGRSAKAKAKALKTRAKGKSPKYKPSKRNRTKDEEL